MPQAVSISDLTDLAAVVVGGGNDSSVNFVGRNRITVISFSHY